MYTNKRKCRDLSRLLISLLFSVLYLPHIILYYLGGARANIDKDIRAIAHQVSINLPRCLGFIYHIHTNRYFRTLFYFRIGAVASLLIGWYRPGDKYFQISKTTVIGGGFVFAHPYATIINAEIIGDNFSCLHCTTLGATSKGRPIVGNNVSLGANVVIIGNVKIGNNVTIGAGSVVVKDIPDNSVAVGNPAKVIKIIDLSQPGA